MLPGTVRDPSQDAPTDELESASRWPGSTAGLDVFWPVLAVVLVVTVIFVASVAHNSMETVGISVTPGAARTPKPTGTSGPLLIVQVSSHATRSAAAAAAQELTDRGFDARVLKSDNYQPLNRGYYVVYTGPYPVSAAGRAAARRVQAKLDEALVRDISPR